MIIVCEFCRRTPKQYRKAAAEFQDKEYGESNRVQNRKESDHKLVVCTVCGKENRI